MKVQFFIISTFVLLLFKKSIGASVPEISGESYFSVNLQWSIDELKNDLRNLKKKVEDFVGKTEKTESTLPSYSLNLLNIINKNQQIIYLKNQLEKTIPVLKKSSCQRNFENRFNEINTRILKKVADIFDEKIDEAQFFLIHINKEISIIEYELNDDQERLINECKKDMEACKIMHEYREFAKENITKLQNLKVNLENEIELLVLKVTKCLHD